MKHYTVEPLANAAPPMWIVVVWDDAHPTISTPMAKLGHFPDKATAEAIVFELTSTGGLQL